MMKAIMVMFDSLNRHLLPPYGCDWVYAPNFQRLAQRTVTFDRSYVCSMPCMPARRELHTARPNFLHRSWGPLEPFDDSVPEMLKKAGVSTHLVTDHYHYWEDGGANYMTRYNTHQTFRGQEGDFWMGQVADPRIPPDVSKRSGETWRQDWVNRQFLRREEDQPQSGTFRAGLDFIRRNHTADRWFLQIETFDPHEPFFTQRKYKSLYREHYRTYKGRHFDWPPYRHVQELPEQIEHARYEYAALLSMCDAHLGRVLDAMDELDLWKDTLLLVWTDHGFLLGEHDCWAKCWCPLYQENAHTPFFVWDPRAPATAGQRRQSLVQPALDCGPTLLEFFGVAPTADMLGRSLRGAVANDAPVRTAGLFGIHGGHVNVTDGRYVYMRAPVTLNNAPLFEYTYEPSHMRIPFGVDALQQAALAEPFLFTKGCRLLRIPMHDPGWPVPEFRGGHRLWDVANDPRQERPLADAAREHTMLDHLVRLLRECDAPAEQYERLGLRA